MKDPLPNSSGRGRRSRISAAGEQSEREKGLRKEVRPFYGRLFSKRLLKNVAKVECIEPQRVRDIHIRQFDLSQKVAK